MAFVTEPTTRVVYEFVDDSGKHGTTEFWLPGEILDPNDSDVAAMKTALQGLTDAYLAGVQLSVRATQASPQTADTGPYDRVQDKALFEFYGSDGSKAIIKAPAPDDVTFVDGSAQVDVAQADVAAFIAYVLANCLTGEGTPITSLRRAYRMRPSGLKKQ